MKKRLLLFPILFVFSYSVLAQQLTPMVISSSGGFFDNAAGMLSFTTGEMTSIETYSGPGYFLTQGFQQPWELGTSVSSSPAVDFFFSVQPNPSDGYFWLVTSADPAYLIDWKISNVLGKEILEGIYQHSGPTTTQPFDLTSVPPGTYFISMTIHEKKSQPPVHLIQKIQIIR